MKRIDILSRSTRNLRQSKGRTFLTSLAIAVGAFTIMVSLAAGEGTREYTQDLIQSNVDPQSMMITKDDNVDDDSAVMSQRGLQEYNESVDGDTGIQTITQKEIEEIANRDEVESVTPFYQIKADWATFEGIDKKYSMNLAMFDPYIKSEVVAGELPERGQQIAEDEVVIPDDFAKTLDKEPSELIGKKVVVTTSGRGEELSQEKLMSLFASGGPTAVQEAMRGETKDITLTIRAVIAAKAGSAQVSSAGSNAAVHRNLAKEMSDFTTQGTKGYQQYYTATVRIKDGFDPAELKQSFKDAGYESMTAEDMQEMVYQFVNILQYIVIGFGILALIASVFGIINTQYISVLERTSQIGLMKALGMSNRGVGSMFRYEAAWIGFLGGLIGIALAWVAVYFLNPWINEQLSLGEGIYLLKFNFVSAVVLLVVLMIIAIVAGWFPARKAAKLDPIEALRTE